MSTWTRLDSGNYLCQYRGITLRINLDSRGRPLAILFFVNGSLDSESPPNPHITVEQAQRIATQVVDTIIPTNPVWQAAERKEREQAFLRR